MNILVIDGQGGGVGKMLVTQLISAIPYAVVTAVGTNSTATAAMLKAGAANAATGENAVKVCSARADIIVGPMGIVIADSMLGEISPAMAVSVGSSSALKVLLPVNRCETIVAGMPSLAVGEIVNEAVTKIRDIVSAANL